jgi:HK97 family phage major capsid protein
MTEEEKVKAEKDALEKVKASAKEAADAAVKQVKDDGEKALKAQKEAFDKEIEALKKANKETQDHADELDIKLQGGAGGTGGESLVKALEGFDMDKIKSGEGGFQEITVKAAAPMTVPLVNATSSPYVGSVEVMSGINHAPVGDMSILEDADTAGTNAATIVWINKVNPQGNAAFIGETILKPLRSFEVKAETSNAKKIAVRFNVSTESLEDLDFLASEINKDGIEELNRKTNDALLSSTGAGAQAAEPKGVIKYASAFSLTTVKGEDPDNFGALRAAVAQVRIMKFRANRAYVNPIDAANMDLKKGANGQYVLPPFTTADGQKIGATLIKETDEIPVGFFLVGDMKKYHVRKYKGIQIKTGLNADDFSKNMVTIIVEQRLHAFVNSIDTGAFVYDSFATVKAAIKAVAA